MDTDRPNVLIITTHDSGRHFGCYGVDTGHSPAIDSLAADGIRFTRYFSASPVCSASRAAMLTGRYPQSNGLMLLSSPPWSWELNSDERHLSQLLRDEGYYTVLFGLQHETENPDRLGFRARHRECHRDMRFAADAACTATDIAGDVAHFLRSDAASRAPFYAQVGFYETHTPYDFGGAVPDDEKGVYVPPYLVRNEAATEEFAGLQGSVHRADEAVGIIQSALSEADLERDTLVVFTSDHGIETHRSKWFVYDRGLEIPLIVRWPNGGIQGGRDCDWLLSNVDFLPTLLELLGVPVPGNVQGVSFAAAFGPSGAAESGPRRKIFAMMQAFHQYPDMRCVRTTRHKLVRSFTPDRAYTTPVDLERPSRPWKRPVVELFDLERDPLEVDNVAQRPEYAEVYRDLSNRLWGWLEAVDDPILKGPVPSPYYHEAIAEYRAAGRGGDPPGLIGD